MKFTAKDIIPLVLFVIIFAFLVYSDLGAVEAGLGEAVPSVLNFLVLVLFISVVEYPIRRNKQLNKQSAEYKQIRKKTNIKLIILVLVFLAGSAIIKNAKDSRYEQMEADYQTELDETTETAPAENY